MKLTQKQKDELFCKHDSGDLDMLSYISELMKKSKDIGIDTELEEQIELCNSVIDLNYMNDIIETKDYDTFSKYSGRISDLYYGMKWELFISVGITEKDFEGHDW